MNPLFRCSSMLHSQADFRLSYQSRRQSSNSRYLASWFMERETQDRRSHLPIMND
jgi:hypothetical protein